jgi:hypothetical protein
MRFSWLFAIIGFSEDEAIAAQAEKPSVAVPRRVNSREELMRHVSAAVLVVLRAVLVGHRDAGACRFRNV